MKIINIKLALCAFLVLNSLSLYGIFSVYSRVPKRIQALNNKKAALKGQIVQAREKRDAALKGQQNSWEILADLSEPVKDGERALRVVEAQLDSKVPSMKEIEELKKKKVALQELLDEQEIEKDLAMGLKRRGTLTNSRFYDGPIKDTKAELRKVYVQLEKGAPRERKKERAGLTRQALKLAAVLVDRMEKSAHVDEMRPTRLSLAYNLARLSNKAPSDKKLAQLKIQEQELSTNEEKHDDEKELRLKIVREDIRKGNERQKRQKERIEWSKWLNK